MSSFEINNLVNNSVGNLSGPTKKSVSFKSAGQKNALSKLEDGFTKKLFQSPAKLAKAIKTIDSIGINLQEINSFIEEAIDGNYTDSDKAVKEEKFLEIISDVKNLKETSEFKAIHNKLKNAGINLNIGSQKVDNFLNHFFDTTLDESQPDLSGIYDQESSINRLNTKDFTVVDKFIIAELSSIEEGTNSLEGIALLNKETAQIDNTMNLQSVSESFSTFPSRTYASEDNKVLVALDGLQTSDNIEDDFAAGYLFDSESLEQIVAFKHEDFSTNMTFKGGEIKDEHVYLSSDGAEYIFKTDGEFINKFKTENGHKLNEARVIGNDLFAIAATSKPENGRVVGALYQFDLASGEQKAEIANPNTNANGTFGVNIESFESKLFIAENEVIKKDGDYFTQGTIHVFDTETGTFTGEINPKNDIKGTGVFGESITVNENFIAVSSRASTATGTEHSSIHVFNSDKGKQIHKITPQYYGTELSGSIEINDNKLLVSSEDKAGRSNIYEFDLSTRDKNLEKFMSMIGDDARVIDAIKTSIVADRLSTMNTNSTYTGRDGKESTYAGRNGKESTYTGRESLNSHTESLYTGRDGKESTYAGRNNKESTYAGRDAKESTYTGRDNKEYLGREKLKL